jgi:ribonuclease J
MCVEASKLSRPVCFPSASLQKKFEFLKDKKNFYLRNLHIVPLEEIEKYPNVVIVITGIPSLLFNKLRKIMTDDDQFIHIKPTDAFILAAPTISGYETLEAQLFDDADRTPLQRVHKLEKSILNMSASAEDHKLLVEMLHPKYVIPVSGLFMNFMDYQHQVMETGYPKNNVLTLENGQMVSFNNGLIESHKKLIKLEPQFIGASGALDTGASSIFEREQMKENGAVLVSFLVDKSTKTIKHSNYDAVGVTELTEENRKIITTINEECNKQISELFVTTFKQQPVDLKNLKTLVRKIIDKQYERKFNKKPLVLTTIIFNKDRSHQPPKENI